jgi:hypothetical protein
VVVCPLVSLIVDQVFHLKKLGILFIWNLFLHNLLCYMVIFSLDSCGTPKSHGGRNQRNISESWKKQTR